MTFAMIAAGAILATGESIRSTTVRAMPCEQVYQFVVVPGGGVSAMPVPYVMMLPLGKLDKLRIPSLAHSRADLKFVFEAEQEAASLRSVTKTLVEELKYANERGREFEFTTQFGGTLSSKFCLTKQTDPKQVIDPIVTGY